MVRPLRAATGYELMWRDATWPTGLGHGSGR